MKHTTTLERGAITAPIYNPPSTYHDPLLDSREAAKVLGLDSHHTLEVWRCVGRHSELEYIRIGRKIKYRLSSLHAFLENNTVRSKAGV